MPGRSSTVVLGVSADFHDAAAALVVDGDLVAAAEEERFTRVKHDPSLPRHAMAWCLEHAGLSRGDQIIVAFYEKPLSAYDRVLSTHAVAGPRGFPALARAVGQWSGSKLWIGYRLERALREWGIECGRVRFVEHHQSHAASAFYPSPFDRAAVLVVDGVGEWASSSIAWGAGNRLEMRRETRFPDSLGLLYSAMTTFCGFAANEGEGTFMGLAPYGEPRFADVLRDQVVHVAGDGSVRLDQRWFDYRSGRRMTRPSLAALLGGPPRRTDEPLDQRHADIARSVQLVLEEAVVAMGREARAVTGERVACLAGGVALNCVANRALLDAEVFDDVWVQPACSDAGGSVGAALWTWHQVLDEPRPAGRTVDSMKGAFLGPSFDAGEIRAWLVESAIPFVEHPDPDALCRSVAAALDQGALVGWFQGAMELGPRALGHRSILADARDVDNVARINARVKGREGFRPFAPAVLAERASEWFDLRGELPYMTVTAPVHDDQRREVETSVADGFAERLAQVRSTIPACTHVDGSARVQTVDAERNPEFHRLLRAFEDLTGCPVLVNTSFNRSGEPIVRTPADAYRTFRDSGLDLVALDRFVVSR